MTRLGLRSFTCLCLGLLACPADTSGVDEDTGDSSDSGSESGTNPSTDPMTMTDPTDVSADGSSSSGGSADTGPDDTGTDTGTGTEGSTTDPDSGSETAGSSEDSSTGTPPGGEYPPCMADDECSDPYTLCWPSDDFGMPNYCTLECESADDCPVPSSGEAVPVCEGPPDIDICALDCTDGECPDGMTCVEIFMDFERCVYEA
jgi:hypothetical protein